METIQTTRENISALADGELPDAQLDAAFVTLREAEARSDWDVYHRIGDALRSDEVADISLSADFSARLAARLAAEPAIVAPAAHVDNKAVAQRAGVRRWALPGAAAAAAMAGVAFFATPQLMVALNGPPAPVAAEAVYAGAAPASGVVPVVAGNAVAATPTADSGEVVLRDANIDDYLMAHQRLSPSVYSSAQYPRSATLATEVRK